MRQTAHASSKISELNGDQSDEKQAPSMACCGVGMGRRETGKKAPDLQQAVLRQLTTVCRSRTGTLMFTSCSTTERDTDDEGPLASAKRRATEP